MLTFAQKQKPTEKGKSASLSGSRLPFNRQSPEVGNILQLQRAIGNRDVQRLLQVNSEEGGGSLLTSATSHYGHDFSQIPVQSSRTGNVQSKLELGAPGDKYEQEADRVADKVMRMPEPNVRGNASAGRKAQGSPRSALSSSGGHALDAAERAYFEPRFGYDFSRVRIHDASGPDSAARMLGARAFTLGSDIFFRSGVRSDMPEGRRTLAHELTHVVQQGSAALHADMGTHSIATHLSDDSSPVGLIQRTPDGPTIQMDCAEDKRKCRNPVNWTDGGHWIGTGSQPDCNCDSTFSDAQAACRNRLNWSDGGHWIGSGPEPDCSLTRTGESRYTLTYLFPTNECVQQFNADRNAITTHLSTGAGILTGSIAAMAGGHPAYGIVAGGVVNELIGAIPQTPMGVGYRWVRVMIARYTRSAHPWGVNRLTMGIESSVFNENNQLVQGYFTSYEFTDEAIVRLGPLFVGQGNRSRTKRCPQGNVLSM